VSKRVLEKQSCDTSLRDSLNASDAPSELRISDNQPSPHFSPSSHAFLTHVAVVLVTLRKSHPLYLRLRAGGQRQQNLPFYPWLIPVFSKSYAMLRFLADSDSDEGFLTHHKDE